MSASNLAKKPNKVRMLRFGFMGPVSGRQTCPECDTIARSFEAARTKKCDGSSRDGQVYAGRDAHDTPSLTLERGGHMGLHNVFCIMYFA